jgi:hypothetical protein
MATWRWEGFAAGGCLLLTACLLALNWPLKIGPLVWLALLIFGAGLAWSGLGRGHSASRILTGVALVLNALFAVVLLLVAFAGLRQMQ